MIGIVDYGLGNVLAFQNIYTRLGVPVEVISNSIRFKDVQGIVLPGVGAFDWAMRALDRTGLRDAMTEAVIGRKLPILGVCVGMQMFAASSDEGECDGLGWIDGRVRSFHHLHSEKNHVLPHMGWNDVVQHQTHPLFNYLDADSKFYFLHSYYFDTGNEDIILAKTEYGAQFPSSVFHGNILGVQFHPEKSHGWGVQLLRNFADITGC